jgi:hypothetical protein
MRAITADDLRAKLRELIGQRQSFTRYKAPKLAAGFDGHVVVEAGEGGGDQLQEAAVQANEKEKNEASESNDFDVRSHVAVIGKGD